MGDRMASARNQLNQLAIYLKAKAGWCAANVSDVDAYLQKGEEYTKYAYHSTDFINVDPKIREQLSKAAEGLENVRKGVGAAKKLCLNTRAAADISIAIAILNEWSAGRAGPKEAAKAFDLLFGGAAKFAEMLPFPANQYARILEQVGISKFFANMQDLMDPESPNTPRGRAMRQALEAR